MRTSRADNPGKMAAKYGEPEGAEAAAAQLYNVMWTDDYPSMRVVVETTENWHITLSSEEQRSFMLPWKVEGLGKPFETHDPRLSRAIAGLLPEGFLDRERLVDDAFLVELLTWI